MATTPDYGTDVSTYFGDGPEGPDLDPSFRIISGPRVIAEAVARRWHMSRGELWDDPDAGEDTRWMLNAKTTESRRLAKQSALAAEAEKDERVESCDVLITLSADGKSMRIRGTIFPADDSPPFGVVVDPSTLTLEVLKGIG